MILGQPSSVLVTFQTLLDILTRNAYLFGYDNDCGSQ